jgi:hypothetical protein
MCLAARILLWVLALARDAGSIASPRRTKMEPKNSSSKSSATGKDPGLTATVGAKLANVAARGAEVAVDVQASVEGLATAGVHRVQESAEKAGHAVEELATRVSHTAKEATQKALNRTQEAGTARENRRQEHQTKR